MSIGAILRFFGYAKVPPEVSRMASMTRMLWLRDPTNRKVGIALEVMERFMRSTQ